MTYLADLHSHSPFSLATSRAATLAGLAGWAGVKGLALIGTGDFTHPAWLRELENQLQPAEPGFFKLRDEKIPPPLPGLLRVPGPIRFLLSAEISCIYRKEGRTRKIHCLLYVPDFASVKRLNRRLVPFGMLASDGRPTLRLDARDLLEILLDQAPEGFLVPAHVWTPWFSLFGTRSGFNSLEECFGDLSGQIFALETGLSSDPAMNRRISALDRFSLISNSDCHSPAKLGREANILSGPFDYYSLREGLKLPGTGLAGTIEFFPQEGKYYADGHRRCRFRSEEGELPATSLCPVCRRRLTTGVRSRVRELADRPGPRFPTRAPAVHHLVPLPEIIADITGRGISSKTVRDFYVAAINRLGPELPLLMGAPLPEIASFSGPLVTAIDRLRRGLVQKLSGFDGQPGRILLFREEERPGLRPPFY
jgi:uncharacterized protein (TIGR00375 family)